MPVALDGLVMPKVVNEEIDDGVEHLAGCLGRVEGVVLVVLVVLDMVASPEAGSQGEGVVVASPESQGLVNAGHQED